MERTAPDPKTMLFPELAYQSSVREVEARQARASTLGAGRPKEEATLHRIKSALGRLEDPQYENDQSLEKPELASMTQRDRSADPDLIENAVKKLEQVTH